MDSTRELLCGWRALLALASCLECAFLRLDAWRLRNAPPAPWVAPDDAKKVKNPVPPTQETLAEAQQLFTDNCVLCHGEKGMGMVPVPRPSK